MANSYRELTAPELVTWFGSLTKGYIHKGRDAAALSHYMQTRMIAPTQVLLGMFEFRKTSETKDIPTFLRGDWPMGQDLLQDEAELVLYLTSQPTPSCYITYCDLIDLDMLDARFEKAFQEAKAELEKFCDHALTKPAALRAGSRPPRKPHNPRQAYPTPGQRRRS